MDIARQQVAKHIHRVTLSTIEGYRLLGNGAVNTGFSLRPVPRSYKEAEKMDPRLEAGSNTSIVTLRVVGADEMGNLKSETVK
jgi:hypothetical protein